jgi:hypothetical protein
MNAEIYQYIKNMQDEIGNGAEVRLAVKDEKLELRVDWWPDDFHFRQLYPPECLPSEGGDARETEYIIGSCRHLHREELGRRRELQR